MATVQEAVRRLRIQASDTGLSETTEKLKNLAKAQDSVAVVSQKSERATLSMERRLESISRRYDADHRAQRELAKVQKDLDAARAQGLVSAARANELLALARERHMGAAQAAGAYGKALQAANDNVMGYAGRLGAVGAALTGLGPVGLGAVVVITALAVAFSYASREAHKLAEESLKMRDVAANIGISTTQLQAIADAGSKFALSEEKVGTALQRFSAQMEEFRRGEGALFELIQRIDPALARQMAGARNTAKELDLLGQAYEKAGQRSVALSRTAFGRAGMDIGLLLQEVRRKGGVAALTQDFVDSGDALDKHLIERIAVLKAEIDDMAADARRNFASIFSEKFLEVEFKATEQFREFSRVAKEFAMSPDLAKFINVTAHGATTEFAGNWARILSPIPGVGPLIQSTQPFASQIARPAGSTGGAGAGFQTPTSDLRSQGMSMLRDAMVAKYGDPQAPKQSAELALNLTKQYMQVLGEAATPAEQLKLKQLELAAATEKFGLSQDIAARALAYFKEQQAAAAAQQRATLGIAQEGELQAVALAQIKRMEVNGYIRGEEEKAQATRILLKQVKESYDEMRVRASDLPNLTRLAIDAGNLNKQLDQVLTSSFSAMENSFADFIMGTKSAKQAFTDMANSIIRDLARMVFRQTVTAPLANLISSGIKGLFGGFGTMHEGGIVGMDAGPARYIHPMHFNDAPRFAMGGIAGLGPDEVPIVAHRNEEILRRDDPRHRYNGGAGQNVYNDNRRYDFRGANKDSEARLRAMMKQEAAQARKGALSDVRTADRNLPGWSRR